MRKPREPRKPSKPTKTVMSCVTKGKNSKAAIWGYDDTLEVIAQDDIVEIAEGIKKGKHKPCEPSAGDLIEPLSWSIEIEHHGDYDCAGLSIWLAFEFTNKFFNEQMKVYHSNLKNFKVKMGEYKQKLAEWEDAKRERMKQKAQQLREQADKIEEELGS